MDESCQLHTPAALLPRKEPAKSSNRNLGGPHIMVENFHLKFIPIGCSPHLKKILEEYFKITQYNRPNRKLGKNP